MGRWSPLQVYYLKLPVLPGEDHIP
jgi:hypothetical protein